MCAGRAGRDGQPARCMLMYRFSDALRQAAIVCSEPTWQPNLFAMMQYACVLSTCRRAVICRCSLLSTFCSCSFMLYLTVWGVEPVVTHQTS